MLADFQRRFWVALVLMVPVLVLAPMIQAWFGYRLSFPGDRYVVAVLATVLYGYGGWPFLKGMVDELRQRQPGMMTLVALAITVAYVYSTAIAFGLEGMTFYWELATLIVLMLAGHWIEMKSVMQASNALEKLMALMPDTAHRVRSDGGTEEVPVQELKQGDVILVKPGEKVAADGTVQEGKSFLDESVLTGESKPVERHEGQAVIAGAINGKGSLRVRVKAAQDDSYLSKVIRLVNDAQQKKSRTQHLADRAAFWLTFVALGAGAVTLVAWLLAGRELSFVLERVVTVMVIACPHALGLAIPLVVAISTSMAARNQLLIRNRTAFENARKIDTLVFDKTGTLTLGTFAVTRYEGRNGFDAQEVLRLAAAAEQDSEHPIAGGILKTARDANLTLPASRAFENRTGEGIRAEVEGKTVEVVSPGYATKRGFGAAAQVDATEAETLVFVLVDGTLAGYLALSDQVRATSADAIRTLKAMGIKTYMMTGDVENVARHLSQQLQMDGYFAGVLPDQKQEKVKQLQHEGRFVAMTGDGVNDAPALAQANVGIAVGSGTDVAAETADIILVESDPQDVVKLIRFGRATYRKMIQNLFYATAYNVVAIPLGAGALAWAGIMISPAVGAILMSLSTVVVAINAQLLRRSMKKEVRSIVP